MLPARIAVLNAEMIAEMIAGMIAGLHLCAVMTPGVEMIVHPCAAEVTGMVPGMPLVGMTAGDPAMLVVKTIGGQDPEHFRLVKKDGMTAGMTAGMTVGLDSLLRRMHPQ